MARLSALAALFLVASCSAPRQPAPGPTPVPVPTPAPRPVAPPPAPPPTALWEDRIATPGDWVYRQDSKGSIALFGAAGADALFVMRCDTTARKVYLSRAGARAVDDPVGAMTIRASAGIKSFPAADTGGTPAYLAAAVQPADPHLDAMAFSRGKFLVSVKGQQDLVVPAWAEVTRIVEDCRK